MFFAFAHYELQIYDLHMLKKSLYPILFNITFFAFYSICYFASNFILAKFYDVESFGAFGVIYSYFFIFGSFLTFGAHNFIILELPISKTPNITFLKVFKKMLTLGAFVLLGLTLTFLLVNNFYKIKEVFFLNLIFTSIAAVLFAVNKLFTTRLSALGQVKSFGALNGIRFLFFFLCAVVFALKEVEVQYSGCIILFSEICTLLTILLPNYKVFTSAEVGKPLFITKYNLKFKAYNLTAFIIIASRIRGVMMIIPFFLDARSIGIIAFVIIFVEGFGQFCGVIKFIFNARIVKLVSSNKQEAKHYLLLLQKNCIIYFFLVYLASIPAFYLLIKLFFPHMGEEAVYLYLIYMLGAVAISPFIVVDNIFYMVGKMRLDLILNILYFFSFLALNVLFTLSFGLFGVGASYLTINIMFIILLYIYFLLRL